MLVFALILLFFANDQPPSVLIDSAARRRRRTATYLPTFALGMFMAVVRRVRLRHRRDVRRGDASTPAARRRAASCRRSSISGLVGADLPPRRSSSPSRTSPPRWPRARRRLPDRDDHHRAPSRRRSSAGITVGEIYLLVILASVFVCTLAIQGAATRMMFSMGRDRHLPLGGIWGHVNTRFRTPANAAIARRRPRRDPDPRHRPVRRLLASRSPRPGLIYLSYFLCNIGVLARPVPRLAAQEGLVQPRSLGQAREHPGAGLRRPDDHQHRPLGGRGAVRRLRGPTAARSGTRSSTRSSSRSATRSTGMPAWPIFETLVGLILIVGGDLLRRWPSGGQARPTPRPARPSSAGRTG